MKPLSQRRSAPFLGLVLLLLWPSLGQALPPSGLTFPALEFHPPQAEEIRLDNGMRLYLMEDHELPLINLTARIRTGSIYEPLDKVGLAEIFGTVMRTGGTVHRTPEEINETLEYIAASVETRVSREYATATLSVLKEDLDTGLEIFADVLMHPAFREDKIRLKQQQMIEEIRRRNDNPTQIAMREFAALLYGRTHPYGRYEEVETVLNVTREDLLDFHRRYYHPNNLWLAASGDFQREDLIARLQRVFAGWEPAEIEFPALPPVSERYERTVNCVAKGVNQSTIFVGHLGITRHSPDRIPFEVLNFILGGSGLTSRLMREVRSRQGLAYSVGSFYTLRDDLGLFVAYSLTRAEATVKALRLMLEILQRIREEPVSEEELRVAKDSLINSYVFDFDSSHKIATQQMALDYFGYPDNWLITYPDKVAAVTKEDLLRVAQKYLRPAEATILVVGEAEKFSESLAAFGEVHTIVLKEPPPLPVRGEQPSRPRLRLRKKG